MFLPEDFEFPSKLGRYKMACPCSDAPGKSKSLSVQYCKYSGQKEEYQGMSGYLYHCFRCGMKGFRVEGESTPEDIISNKRSRSAMDVSYATKNDLQLPADFSNELPEQAWLWLNKYGITAEEAHAYNFGYSYFYDRLIMPVYENGSNSKLIYWQGRNLGKVTPEKPKYINAKQERSDIFFRVEQEGIEANKSKVILVEDVVSAIKIGRQFNCIALLTTSMPNEFIQDLARSGRAVIIWLDYDKRAKMVRDVLKLQSFGIKARRVLTVKDPKAYSDEEIKEILNE